jgi:hypothetical protein
MKFIVPKASNKIRNLMFFLIFFVFFLLLPKKISAQIPNPAFCEKNNQASFHFGQSMRGNLENLFLFGLNYSQPDQFFRLPGRINVEFMTQRGTNGFSKYNQNIIFGFSQDLISPAVWRMYGGINLGIYIKSQTTDRISSRFTFGERAFLGFRVIDALVLELFARHFSNGDLTNINAGQNFVGLSAMWNFSISKNKQDNN